MQKDNTSFLYANSYNQLVLDISRTYIFEFKKFLKSKKKSFTYTNSIMFFDEVPIKIKVKKTVYDPEGEDYAFDFDSYVDSDSDLTKLVINININKDHFPHSLNEFIAELKDSLRHELEHVSQFNNTDKSLYLDNIKNKDELKIHEIKTKNKYLKYVIEYEEVFAYLHGFHQRSKTTNVSMNEIIDEWINSRDYEYDTVEEMEIIRTLYITAGHKFLPLAHWK